jgi:hypothetical protein
MTAWVLLAGCGLRRTAPPELPKVFTEKESPARPGSVPMKPLTPSAGPSAGKDAPAVRGYIPKDDPLFAVPGEPITADDFTLGALQGRFVTGGEEKAVYTLFAMFFQNLREGKSVKNLLHPDYRPFLSRDLDPLEGKKIAFDSVRFGEFALQSRGGPMVETHVLVLGKKGRAEGKILAERVGGTWYISLVLLDLEELDLPFKKHSDGPFTPKQKGPLF